MSAESWLSSGAMGRLVAIAVPDGEATDTSRPFGGAESIGCPMGGVGGADGGQG
jgi:hypothetical protein